MVTEPNEFIQKLQELQDSTEVTYTTLPSDEPRFIIDANTRSITIPPEFQFLGVKNDHKAETVYFEIDRYFDAMDLSTQTCVIQFSNNENSGFYPVTSMDTVTVDGKIIFGWEILNDVTAAIGNISFSVRFYTIDESNQFTYNFNTLTVNSVILDTLDVDNPGVVENYPSELEAWLDRMNKLEAGTSGKVEEIEAKGQEVLTEINSVKDSIPEDYSTLSSDVNGLKGDLDKLDESFNETIPYQPVSYGKTINDFSGLSTKYYGFMFAVKPPVNELKVIKIYLKDIVSGANINIRIKTSNGEVISSEEHITIKSNDNQYHWYTVEFDNAVKCNDYEFIYIDIKSTTDGQFVTYGKADNKEICVGNETDKKTYYSSDYSADWNNDVWSVSGSIYYYCVIDFVKYERHLLIPFPEETEEHINFDLGLFDKVGAGGDSFTLGTTGNSAGEYIRLNSSWFEQLCRRNGVRYFKNYAMGGHSTRSWITMDDGLPKALSETACDCYLLGFGINDSTDLGLNYLGTLADIKDDYNQNSDSFYGNYGKIIAQLREHSPNAKFFLFPIWYSHNHQYKTEYNNAIREIANKFSGAFYIDIFSDSFFSSDIYSVTPNAHPSVLSYNGMSHAIERLINKVITENWREFIYSIVG